jgi:hypothetical protein
LLNATLPGGLPITHVVISRTGMTISWFIDFLSGKENIAADYEVDDKKYSWCRDDKGCVFISELRSGHFLNGVGYSSDEIQSVLEELMQNITKQAG